MVKVDTFPTMKIGDLEYRSGRVFPFGATVTDGGINFSVFSKEARSCTLLLFHAGEEEPFMTIPFPEEFRIGNVYTMMVFGINVEETEYAYCFDGEFDARKGLRFDKTRVLLDPYAKSVSGRNVWGQTGKDGKRPGYRGRFVFEDYAWEGDKPLEYPEKDLVIYEMHVRSFTQHPSSGVRRRGVFSGILEKIPYLKELGVNCIELMPIFEFDELENSRTYQGRELMNYWGYSTVAFFAPKAGYAEAAPFGMEVDELKNLIKQLHKNGIEVILDVVFNHTAEGNENGPYISFRGIDNRTYYLLSPEGEYLNFSGCGNTLNCNDVVVRNMIEDCLRYWVSAYHVDGFRFDLASILTRDEDGSPMMSPPLVESLAQDPVLARTTLIAEAWDAGGLYQVGNFPAWNRWVEWNGKYRDCLRRFIKGDGDRAPELYIRIRGSNDMYSSRGPTASVNFVTCHDGFTLYDLVSYNEKHNEANGEDNRDGSNCNDSWNCGIEGETDDPAVNALRFRQIKNMLTILLTSRGIPMLLAGDEFGNTQWGNNNAYCQDNEVSWLDWNLLKKNQDLFRYVKGLIAFRKEHPILRDADYEFGHNGTGYPELSFHGTTPWSLDETAASLIFAYMFAEDHEYYGTRQDCFIYVAVNAHWEEHAFTLPIVPAQVRWRIAFDSSSSMDGQGGGLHFKENELHLGPRSTAILVAE